MRRTWKPTSQPDRAGRHRAGRLSGTGRVIVAGAAVLALLGAGLGVTAAVHSTATSGVYDLHGNTVRMDPGTLPDVSTRKQMNATTDVGERITVPSVGLDEPIGAISAVNGVLTPPGFTSVYAVRNVGARIPSNT